MGAAGATACTCTLVLVLLLLGLLSALEVAVRGTVPVVVGMKVTVQLLREAPVASDAKVAGQPLVVAPGGKVPVKLQLALIAAVVALLVQVSVQVTRLPTPAGFGLQLIDGARLATVTVIRLVAVSQAVVTTLLQIR